MPEIRDATCEVCGKLVLGVLALTFFIGCAGYDVIDCENDMWDATSCAEVTTSFYTACEATCRAQAESGECINNVECYEAVGAVAECRCCCGSTCERPRTQVWSVQYPPECQ
jgi:hypothetical protein